jgi:HEAT repeat protein
MVMPSIINLLGDSNTEVRRGAALTLEYFVFDPEAAMTALITALNDPDPNVRKNAAVSLDSIALCLEDKEVAKPFVPKLIAKLDSNDKTMTLYIVWTLGKLGPLARDAVPKLTKMLQDKDLRWAATEALKEIGGGTHETVTGLCQVLRGSDFVQVRAAASALGKMGARARSAVPHLIKLLKSNSERVRGTAAWALGEIGDKSAMTALSEALKDDFENVRDAAARALRALRKRKAG